jgi:glycine cleavage system H protein
MASYPEDLKYTKEHEWARVAGAKVTVGITAFAQEQLGDVVYVELPKVGDAIKKGEPFGVVESTKAVSELFAPVSGKVVNTDPYQGGWMIRVEGADAKDLAALMDAAAYTKFIAESHD